ncbi:protein kinase C alpha type-like isoform X2 [Engystomops pustulosus]|uniref:protein kinase C alpha type-like isoform X2 n=1 Tax=Engystomops pustulosus TaxID=76066 RepID=UPI003AFA20D3
MHEVKTFLLQKRTQRDLVLQQRRGIHKEKETFFALGRNDKPSDMDNDASNMVFKRQTLEKTRNTKRHEILNQKRNMENILESHSENSTDEDLQRDILIAMKKIGELVPATRRRNKDTLLKRWRNIISTELEMEEPLQKRPRHVSSSRSEGHQTSNLKREAAQKRIRNNRDWVVQCRRCLIYARPIINGNGALRRSRSSSIDMSFKTCNESLGTVSTPSGSLEQDAPDIFHSAFDQVDMLEEDLGHVYICPPSPTEWVNSSVDLNSLQFINFLGEGTFGKVLLASDPASEELLAVKVMMKSSEVEHDIQTELEVLKIGTGCRFLTSLRAYKETPENYIIVMDYMAGGDLHDLITELMPFDMQTTSDLKPLNILRDANGHIKIADFGLSAVNVFKGERTRGIVGTRGYIAPEVMEGELYNHLVDSFSLGVILFMMSVGDQPYYGQGSMQDYYWSLREDVPVFMPGMCPHAISFIEGLLCKSPCDRLAITSSIKSHPFFHSTDWGAVESGNAHPPFHGDF